MARAPTRIGALLGGRFRLVRLLGGGGTAAVWLAEDEDRGHPVAVKLLHPKLRRSPRSVDRARREAVVLRGFEHPNIAKAVATGLDEEQPFFVMEYLEGQTLDRVIAGWSSPPAPETIESLFLPLVDAVAYAHGAGVVHRDLKPANIMVTEEGVRVLDFGLATLTEGSEHDRTTEGRAVGTFAYMSPEQARGEWVDERTDIFSLGAILFELLTTVRAFGGDPARLAEAMKRGAPPRVSDHRPDLSSSWDDIVAQALHPDRDARTASARMLETEVTFLLRGASDPVAQRPPAPQPAAPRGVSSAPTRPGLGARLMSGLLGLSAVLCLILLGYWWATRPTDPEPATEGAPPPVRPVAASTPKITQRPIEAPEPRPPPAEPPPSPARRRPKRVKTPVVRRARPKPPPVSAVKRALSEARAEPREAARLEALAKAINDAAGDVEDDAKRARIKRLVEVGSMMESLEGLEQAVRELEAAR